VFSKNRDRLLEGDIAARFLAVVLAQPKVNKLLSSDHFSVDGTLIEAWASMKSVKPKDGSGEPPAQGGGRNAEGDLHGQKRSNDSHASTTDPDARLYQGQRQGDQTVLHRAWLMENRHSFRGRDRVGWAFTFAAAAYNLVRLPKLIAQATRFVRLRLPANSAPLRGACRPPLNAPLSRAGPCAPRSRARCKALSVRFPTLGDPHGPSAETPKSQEPFAFCLITLRVAKTATQPARSRSSHGPPVQMDEAVPLNGASNGLSDRRANSTASV
jgi:hypothetical protein